MSAGTAAETPHEASTKRREEGRQRLLLGASLLYVHLWVLEGAVRKWIPQLDAAMYVARDGALVCALVLAVLLYGSSRRHNTLALAFGMGVILASVMAMLQVIIIDGSMTVALMGLRNYIAPLLLPFILYRNELWGFGDRAARILLVYAPIQAVLVVLQVASPSSSWINLEAGGAEAYLTTANGVVRAAGTFTAPAGLIMYATLTLAAGLVVIYRDFAVATSLGWLGIGAVTLTVAIGGSRAAVFTCASIAAAWLLYLTVRGRFQGVVIALFVGLAGTAMYLTAMQVAPGAIDAFATRFASASRSEDTWARILGDAVGFLSGPLSVWGDGFGTHSAIGIALGSGLGWIESDNIRWVAELGIIGYVAALMRLAVGVGLAIWIMAKVRILRMSAFIFGVIIVVGLIAGPLTTQPSTQGQFAIAAGLFLSSLLAKKP